MEDEVDDKQEVRGSNTCKGGEMSLHNFTLFHPKSMYEICGEKETNFHCLSYKFFQFFLEPGTNQMYHKKLFK